MVCEATISDESVYFAFDRTDLSDEAKASLNVFADVAKAQNRNIYIEIQGHTDSKGPEAYNQTLSERRAMAVKAYLVKQGVDSGRIEVKGYGESDPIASNDTEEGRAMIRRIEIRLRPIVIEE